MSAWIQKAIDCAPELRTEFEQPGLTIYTVFIELVPIAQQAHLDNDTDRLQKIYSYAEWCFNQKDEDLWNAAAVCFYEHLGDSDATFPAFTKWVKKEIYIQIRELLSARLDEEKMKTADAYYR